MLAAFCSPRRSFQQGCCACLGVFAAFRAAMVAALLIRCDSWRPATLVEAMPFFKRFGHSVLAMLGDLAATFSKVSEMVLLA